MSSNPNLASCQLQLRSPEPVCFLPIPHNANSAHVDDTLYVRGARIQHDGIRSVMRLDLSQIAESQLVGIMESRWRKVPSYQSFSLSARATTNRVLSRNQTYAACMNSTTSKRA